MILIVNILIILKKNIVYKYFTIFCKGSFDFGKDVKKK